MEKSSRRDRRNQRKTKRSTPPTREWLLTMLQDPRLSGGGAGAMIIAAISVEVSGSARIAAFFFSIGWLFLTWTCYEKGWFEARTWVKVIAFLAVIAIVLATSWWYLIPPPRPPSAQEIATEINKGNSAPIASLRDATIQLDRWEFATDVVMPFQTGKDIALNFFYSNTGTAAASNVHLHARAAFVKNSHEGSDLLFSDIYEEIGNFNKNNREGFMVAPSEPNALSYSSVQIKSPSRDDIDGFYASQRKLLVAVRIEYNYTHYFEYCGLFDRNSLTEYLTAGRMRFIQCFSHNRSATHPAGRVF